MPGLVERLKRVERPFANSEVLIIDTKSWIAISEQVNDKFLSRACDFGLNVVFWKIAKSTRFAS